MFKSLQLRLIFIFVCIAIALVIIVGMSLNRMVASSYYETFLSQMERGFDNWQISYDSDYDQVYEYMVEEKNGILLFLANKYKTYTLIHLDQKEVGYSYYDKYSEADYYEILDSENYLLALENGKGDLQNLMKDEDGAYFDYARKIGNTMIYFRYDDNEWRSVIENFNQIILISGLVAVIAALLIGILMSRTITSPIVKLMNRAKGLAEGKFDEQIEVQSEDEIGKLSETFNFMAGELKNRIAEVSLEKNKMETILNYMTDGIVAFDSKGKIIHINPACLSTLVEPKITDDFNTFMARFGLNTKIEEVIDKTIQEDVMYNNQFLKFFFAPFLDSKNDADGVILVIQDYTSMMKLEEMRREFVANVSHELRTPLTSIVSYSEALIEGAKEDGEILTQFLDVIYKESNRMSRLVKELLTLSRMDSNRQEWRFRKANLNKLVLEVVEKLMIEAENKEINLESYLLNDVPDVMIDIDKMEQVIQNIISNAIKYTEIQGKINVYVGTINEFVYFKVSDSGIGIPKEDIDRIFERFYRVDKARSRDMGGTGLGLAIAKEIVDAHKGEIFVKSEIDKGTEIVVRIPI